MYNKSSQRAFQSLVTPETLPQKPLKIKSPDNSQTHSRRQSQINDSPSKDSDNALSFYLSLPQKPSSVTKTSREIKAQQHLQYENFPTEPAQHSKENTPSPQKITTKSTNKSTVHGIISQNSKNKDQKAKGRGIDYMSKQVNKESAYSTAVVSSPKVSPYNSINTAQTHLVKTPNVNRNLVNQINQSIGTYLDNQNQDDSYWESLERRYSSPVHHQSTATEKYSQREAFPWETNEIFGSTRITGHESVPPQTSYNSARRLSKPEYASSTRREKEQDELAQTVVRSIIEKRKSDMFDLPLNVEPEIKDQQVRSPGQVRKNVKGSEQKSNSRIGKDIGEELALTKRMNYSDKEKMRLMEELISLQRELEEKDGEIQELQDEERRQEKEKQRMVEEINMIEQARKENEVEIKKLKEKSNIQVKEISGLKKCKDELERQLKEFGGKAKEFKDCSNRVKKCREEVDKTNKQIMQMNKRLEKIQLEESEAIEEEKKRTEEELRRLTSEVESRDQEIVELEKELKEVNEKREEYKLVAEKIRELEELQMELMEENDTLRERLESFFKDQTNNYKQSQDKDLNIRELQVTDLYSEEIVKFDKDKEHKDMEEVSTSLMKVKKRLEEIETHSKKIMKILEFSRQGKEIPIELILPHNRNARPEKRNKVEEEIVPLKRMNNVELRNVVVENVKLADDIRKRLEQNVASMLEGYLRRDRENNY